MVSPERFADRYRLLDRLGEGAFGVVHAAFDEGILQRKVAIKVLRPSESGAHSEERAARFVTEARLAGALRHPHIAAVYDAGAWRGQLYMVQELVAGRDLDSFVAEHGQIPIALALKLAAQMIDALAHAHEQGVLHRDIKPGNLLIDAEHRVVVVDFGLATSASPEAEARAGSVGTPGYAAPEQVRGRGDARADQFSLAAVIYLLLTGVAPFVGRNLPETLRRTLLHAPDPPSRLRPDLPPGLDRALLRALSKDPADRYPSVRELGAELLAHELGGRIASPEAAQASLSRAARGGALVLVTGPTASPWQRRLGVALGVALGPRPRERQGEDELVAEVLDPRAEVFPSSERPILLRLVDDPALERLREASDGVRAALVTGQPLVLGQGPDDPDLRRFILALRALSPASPPPVILAAERFDLGAIRAAERRGITLLERSPEALLGELAEELPPRRVEARPPVPARPYKFLASFEADDEAIFFGRDVELTRLGARVLAHPITLIYGESGAGKTSLVQAALAPRLRRAGHKVTITRVFDDPLAEICAAAGLPAEPAAERPRRIAEEARAGQLLVVFLDQIEELFLRFPRAARERIAADLRAALDLAEGHLRLVLCLRADHLARLGELKEILPLSLEIGLWLEPLSSAAARAAVEGPAALHGVSVEPALLDALLADLMGEGVDPPQLQLVCDALWEARAPGQPSLGLADYRALGEARDILARHLRATLDGLPPADQSPARDLLKAMVTAHDTRSVKRLADLARGAGLAEERARRLLETLARLRLVRPIQREDGVWFELTHEVLAAEIGRSLSEDDRRIQRVRELLEQGVRGYDQLGLLLSRAQLAVVEPLRHRLELSPAELDLLERSRTDARLGRRRAGATLVAALLALALGVVGARALWLPHQAFARAAEGSLSWFRWGAAEAQPTSTITVWRGAADPWAIDAWLGFPRDPYQTHLTLGDMRPEVRDALRAGLALPSPEEAAPFLAARLGPAAALRERLLAGRWEGAEQALHALADDAGQGPLEALSLAPLVALSAGAPEALVGDLLQIGEQYASELRVPGSDERLERRVGSLLGLLLLTSPREAWAPRLEAMLAEESGPELVGDLLEVAGGPEDLGALGATLGSARPANNEGALAALAAAGGCAWMSAVRELVRAGHPAVDPELARADWLELAAQCAGPEDVDLLVALVDDAAAGRAQLLHAGLALRVLYGLDPALARRALADPTRLETSRRVRLSPWTFLADPAMVATLAPGSYQQIHARLYLGDPSAVWPALTLAFQDRADPTSIAWLWPVALYRGPALQARARALLAERDLPVHLALPMLAIAARGGDEEDARALGLGLAAEDLVKVQIAMDRLVGWRGPLPAGLGGEGRQAGLARALIALRRGEPAPDLFRAALEDPQASWIELSLAMEGQRTRWRADPAGALEALDSPFARTRLAAQLALADLPEPPALEPEADPWRAEALARARWLHHALRVEQGLRARARAAIEAGALLRSRQITRLLRSQQGALPAIGRALAPELPGVMPAEREDETNYLHMLAEMRLGVGNSTEWAIAYLPPDLVRRLGDEPLLADRQDEHLFRVLTGRSPPLPVEDP